MIFALKQIDGSLNLQIHEGDNPINLPEGVSMELKKIANSKVKVSTVNGALRMEIQTPESSGKMKLQIDPDEPFPTPYISHPVDSVAGLIYSLRAKMNGGL